MLIRLFPLLTVLTLGACQPGQTALKPEPVETAPVVVEKPRPAWERLAVAERQICAEPEDLWIRLREGFTLIGKSDDRIEAELKWFARHQAYLDRVAERAQPYLHMIIEEVERRGMPSEIALLPVVESAFQPFAYSHGRAAGLWQFVPGTGRRFGLRQSWWYDGRRDVHEATRAALDYLQYLHRHFDGDWLLALAAYNSGEGTVAKAVRRNKSRGKPTDFFSLDLPRETEGYVPKLLAISMLVDAPELYEVAFKPIANEPVLARVEVDSQIDLDLAAELAGIELEDIYWYNPGFNRWATDPDGPHHLLLPVELVEGFRERLAEYPRDKRIHWARHTIRNGDSLGLIAERYRTTTALIKKVNGMRSSSIRAGRTLIIPVARKDLSRYRLSADNRLKRQQQRERDGVKVMYRVQNGDTLWEIARRYQVGIQSLAKWNGMAPRDTLRPGQTLVIWTRPGERESEQLSELNPANFVHPYADTTRRRIGYTVRNGDSLARIAERFRVSVANLKRWNRLQDKKYLQPGQHLTMYVDVTRQSGSI